VVHDVEQIDALRLALLEDLEIVRPEIRDERAVLVLDDRVHLHVERAHAERGRRRQLKLLCSRRRFENQEREPGGQQRFHGTQ